MIFEIKFKDEEEDESKKLGPGNVPSEEDKEQIKAALKSILYPEDLELENLKPNNPKLEQQQYDCTWTSWTFHVLFEDYHEVKEAINAHPDLFGMIIEVTSGGSLFSINWEVPTHNDDAKLHNMIFDFM